MMADEVNFTAPEEGRKSSGPLQIASDRPAPAPVAPPQFTRGLALRAGEAAIFLVAVVGAIAIGLGITDYFTEHRYVLAYLLAYAGFRFADLLVREEPADSPAREELGRRIVAQFPLLLLFGAAPMERTYLWGGAAPASIAALGLLLELLGMWLVLGARIQLGFFAASRTPGYPILVTSGLFRHVRHPIYAGMFLMLFAWPMEYGAPIAALLTLIAGTIVLHRLIAEEEAELRARFGQEYDAYVRTTDALIPSLW